MRRTAVNLALWTGLLAVWCPAYAASIQMEGGVFRVAGFTAGTPPPEGWASLFKVYAGEGEVPPMLGSYSVEAGILSFRPRFPLAPGIKVRAVFKPPDAKVVTARFEIPKVEIAPSTRVTHVYPSTNVLPENELKFYICFSAPMARSEAWKHIRLLESDGKPVDLPFLEIEQELWDPAAQRLTVLFDPGRIKRGVLPLQEVGPAIQAGKSYTLVIDRAWPDGKGVPLVEGFQKQFRVAPPDRTPPDPANWQITTPRAGTTDALVIRFPDPMDYALLHHSIEIPGVEGTVAVAHEETEWRYTPSRPWSAGAYKLIIQTTLEDLAGNHVLRPFDVDTFEKVTRQIPKETVSLPFRIGR